MSAGVSDADAIDRGGRIVTFYSYKGGTGRSMALANVAWLLASHGKHVLVVDFDLEAPGLHRYFHPFLEDKELAGSAGIIDYFIDATTAARVAYVRKGETPERWFERFATLLPYSRSLDFDFPGDGTIDFVGAGQQDASYAERVTTFDWRGFFADLRGGIVIEALKRQLRKDYDYVLVDSRTGISDTSGICTVQLPDDLAVFFTLNRQSIAGASAVTTSAFEQRRLPNGRPGLRVFPIRTRVERVEAERLQAAKDTAMKAFEPLLCHLTPEQRTAYWGRVEVLYQPFYAHEEVLAVFGDPTAETGSLLAAMEAIAGLLTGEDAVTRPPMKEDQRLEVVAKYLPGVTAGRKPDAPWAAADAGGHRVLADDGAGASHPALSGEAELSSVHAYHSSPDRDGSVFEHVPAADVARYWLYVSYARTDLDPYLRRFVGDLNERIRQVTATQTDSVFFDVSSISTGQDWNDVLHRTLERARVALCVLSPAYFASEYCGKEFAMFCLRAERGSSARGAKAPGRSPGILAIEWVSTSPADHSSLIPAAWVLEAHPDGLRSLIRRRRADYQGLVQDLADHIVDAGHVSPLGEVTLPPFDQIISPFTRGAPTLMRVRVAYVAATVDESPFPDVYGVAPADWRPFPDRKEKVGYFVTQVLARENAFGEEIPADSLGAGAKVARERGDLAIIVVDAASLAIPRCLEAIKSLMPFLGPGVFTLLVDQGILLSSDATAKFLDGIFNAQRVTRPDELEAVLASAIAGWRVRNLDYSAPVPPKLEPT
jgi:hypothetical protein